jgi:hypothetical protein
LLNNIYCLQYCFEFHGCVNNVLFLIVTYW